MTARFRLDRTVAGADIDDVGHVGNVTYLQWVLEVATAHSAAMGWDMAAYQKLGAVWVVKRHEIDYLAPAFAGDAVTLETWVTDWAVATSLRHTRILRGETELAKATTLWVLVSFPGGRPRRVPAEMRADFERWRPDNPDAGQPLPGGRCRNGV